MPSTMRYKRKLFSIHSLMYLLTHFVMTESLPGLRHSGHANAWAAGALPRVGGRRVNQQLKYPVLVVDSDSVLEDGQEGAQGKMKLGCGVKECTGREVGFCESWNACFPRMQRRSMWPDSERNTHL